MKEKNNIVIIDGTSILVDAYYNSLTDELLRCKTSTEREQFFDKLEKNRNGKYIGAVRGLFSVILDAVDKMNPTHLAIVWGTSRKSNIRKKIYSGYKSDDNHMDQPLREQFKTSQILLSPLIKQFTSNKYEAIDLAGTIAKKFASMGKVSIIARNNNYLQLADMADVYIKTSKADELIDKYGLDRDKIPTGFFKYDSDTVKYIKDLEPKQILGFNALVGSPSSGVPGVKGIGAGTALPLIKKYTTIDSIYEAIDNVDNTELSKQWKELKIRASINKLIADKDNALISRDLLTINKDVYIDTSLLETKNSLTLNAVANELNKVGLLVRIPNVLNTESAMISNYRCLLEDMDVGNHSDGYSIPFGLNIQGGIGNRGEEEYIDDMDIDFVESEDECYEISFKSNSVTINSIDSDNDYIIDDIWWDDNDDDLYCSDIDYSGSNCVVDTIMDDSDNNTNENVIELIDTITIRNYRCGNCRETFMIQGDVHVKFCPHCGAKQGVKVNLKLDNLEETGCSLNDIKVKDDVAAKLFV